MPIRSHEATPLKRALEERGITVSELATRFDMDRSYMSYIVNGRAPSAVTARWAPRIAEVLGVPVGELFPQLRTPGETVVTDNDGDPA